jgi:hypothetical protein
MGYNSLKNTNRFDGAWLVPLFTEESVMPLNEIPRYFSSETRRLIDSALEQAWRELKNDAPADPCLARRKPAGTIVALASVGETDPAKLKSFALHAARGARNKLPQGRAAAG